MTSMMRDSIGSFERRFLILLVALGLAACGGKKELKFVGAPTSADGGGGNVSANCGDRVVDADEECDDGARADGDGCDGSCKVEMGWTCTGQPSTCVKCGNGKLETGEECDDGNNDPGDGCSADCKIEGSCMLPLPIALKPSGDGLVGSASGSTSSGDTSQVDAADCAGTKSGGGADRIFEFELPGPADVSVRVGSSFDAIVRVTTAACDLGTQIANGCVDGAAVAGEERTEFDDLPAGKYYIVVDGKTAKQAGDFSVNIEARCPLSGVKIDRVILAEPFRTTLLNTNQSCAVDLSRVGIYAQPEAADIPKTLPAVSLPALSRRLLTSASPPPAGTTYQGNIRFDLENYAGAFYLCRGECDTANGTNVIDALRWGGEKGALSVPAPKALKFASDAPVLTDRAKMSYYRVLTANAFPNFSADDFTDAYWVETFEDGSLGGWDAPVALFYQPKFEKVPGTIGAFSLALIGGNDKDNWNGPNHALRDNAGATMSVSPTYVSVRVRGSDKDLGHGWAFFGHKNSETDGFGSFFRAGGSLTIGSPAVTAIPYTVQTWYQVEYKNFVYTPNGGAGNAGTVDVYVNGGSTPKVKGMKLSTADIAEVSLRNYPSTTTAWVDQIIIR